MSSWHDKFINDVYRFEPRSRNNYPKIIKISYNLSPVTNFLLNIFFRVITNNNLIIVYNSSILKPLALITLLYLKTCNKSVYVLSQKNSSISKRPIDLHVKNFTLLQDSYNHFYFMNYPVGCVENSTISVKLYSKWITKTYREQYIKFLKDNLAKTETAKLLFDNSEEKSRIAENIESLEVEDEIIDKKATIKTDLCIIENVDRFVHSNYKYNEFVKWLQKYKKLDFRFVFHFSNPESSFIENLKREFNCFVLPLGNKFISMNRMLREKSLEYYQENEISNINWSLLNAYNLDSKSDYEHKENISVLEPTLKGGNIDFYYLEIKKLRALIDKESLKNGLKVYTLLKIVNNLQNMVLNPSKFKTLFLSRKGELRYLSIPQIIELTNDATTEESNKNSKILEKICDYAFNLYSELKEVKRFNEITSYERTSKETKLRELVSELDQKDIIISTNSPYERNRIREYFKDNTNIRVFTMKEIYNSIFERKNCILILPGPIRFNYLSELLRPYNKIIILAYEGLNYDIAKKQINLISDFTLAKQEKAINYLQEIFRYLKITNNEILDEFIQKDENTLEEQELEQEQFIKIKSSEGDIEDEEINDKISIHNELPAINEIINNIFSSTNNYDDLREYENDQKSLDKISKEILNQVEKEISKTRTSLSYQVLLKKEGDEGIITKYLDINKTFLTIDEDDGSIIEITPKNLKPGELIVLLGGDERKTLLDTILDTYSFEENIDKEFIEYWKKRTSEYIEYNEITYKEFYNCYKSKGGKKTIQTVYSWIRGSVIGPQVQDDLRLIGEVINDHIISEDYVSMHLEISKLRVLHRKVGKFIKQIVKAILRKERMMKEWSFEETILYERISRGLYRIISIQRVKQ